MGWNKGQNSGMIKRLKVGYHAICFQFILITTDCLSLRVIFCCHIGLKKRKEQLESELEVLGSIREMQLRESETSGKISGLEKKIQYAEIEKVK